MPVSHLPPTLGATPGMAGSLRRICEAYQVRQLALFGSALTDDFSETSDIDLLVDFDPETRVGFLMLSRMQNDLAELFHRPVDLVPKNGLKPVIRDEVLSRAQLLYEN
jgi:predicted nucleotidyltransferase